MEGPPNKPFPLPPFSPFEGNIMLSRWHFYVAIAALLLQGCDLRWLQYKAYWVLKTPLKMKSLWWFIFMQISQIWFILLRLNGEMIKIPPLEKKSLNEGIFFELIKQVCVGYFSLYLENYPWRTWGYFNLLSPMCERETNGGTGNYTFLLCFFFSSLPFPLLFFFFFCTSFKRKYLTEGAFVCFQMIDFGIWATPLAVHG